MAAAFHFLASIDPTTVPTMESNAVVTKLQSAIANFRREKDAAQRNRDLALERLKTSATTLENEVTKTANLQSRLDDIGRKIAAGNGAVSWPSLRWQSELQFAAATDAAPPVREIS